jgi:hypothetical protein
MGARLVAARNEFESFQVVITASDAADGVEVEARNPLVGPAGTRIPARNLTVYREVAYEVDADAGKPPSDGEGAEGEWPDALIPARDYLFGEERAAFPVDVEAGRGLVTWVDLLVPGGAPAGGYRGSVVVSDASGPIDRVPVRVRVLDFSLPSTPTFRTAFGTSPSAPCDAHYSHRCEADSARSWRIHALYARAALENRVTISNPFPIAFGRAPSVRERAFARNAVPLLDPSSRPAIAGGTPMRLVGARMTSVHAYWQCALQRHRCLERWRRLARRYRFSDRFFLLLCDEPATSEAAWRRCRRAADRAGERWPGVRGLVTATVQDGRTSGAQPGEPDAALRRIDILAPAVNLIADREGRFRGDQRPAYDGFLSRPSRPGDPPNELWMYTSCLSYGCDTASPDPYSDGWPGYAIDQPPSQARAMGWLSYAYRTSGELYYDTTRSLATAWTDQYTSGGNGDGTLFYPGAPRGAGGGPPIGGAHEIPIESIRLKRIRDGIEDYEYLRAVGERRGRSVAEAAVTALFGGRDSATYSTAVSGRRLAAARCRLAAMIDESLRGCLPLDSTGGGKSPPG